MGVTGSREGKALRQQAVPGAMSQTDSTVHEGAPRRQSKALPGSVPCSFTTSVPPRQGQSWAPGLALITELIAQTVGDA